MLDQIKAVGGFTLVKNHLLGLEAGLQRAIRQEPNVVLAKPEGEGMRRDGGFELLAIHGGLSRKGLGDAPRMKVAFLREFRKTEVCSAAAASRRARFAQGRPRAQLQLQVADA